MKYKVLTFLFVFTFSFLLFKNNNFDIVIKNKNEKKSSKKEKVDSEENWSERKKKIKGVVGFDSPDKFAELYREIRTREGDLEPKYEPGYKIKELKKAKAKLSSLQKYVSPIDNLNFIERGPANVGGRTRGIYVDPDDESKKTWFAASVGGGVWKTTDAGISWELKTPDLPIMAMSYFGASPANTDVIYVGTGEGMGGLDAIMGSGILKTVDHGETWIQLSSTLTEDFYYVNRLVVDPNDENIVIAATSVGILKSTDGGTSWTKVYNKSAVLDMVANPDNFNTLYGTSIGVGVLKSIDRGDSWAIYNEGLAGAGRMEIDISRTDTSILYISADMTPPTIFMSKNAGEKWEALADLPGSRFENNDWFNGQGWYDNTIAVHPYDEYKIFFGGIDLWKADVTTDSVKGIIEASENGTETFLDFLDSKMSFLNGGLGTGDEYWNESIISNQDDYVDVEVRFGPGMTQMAYMFERTKNYIDFIEVPFQVWDITNNKQLAVCYNDIRRNNKFDLSVTRGDQIFIVNVDYDSVNTNPNLAVENGLKYKNIFVITPKNLQGVTWNPDEHPESNIRIIIGNVPIFYKETGLVTSGYPWNDGYGEVPSIHVDQHEIVIIPINEDTGEFRIVNGNDGGVAYSPDSGVSWTEIDRNGGYNTSQFYGADKKPGASEYFGGMQDNGTWQSEAGIEATAATNYNYRIGGDGFEVAWNYKDANQLIGGSQYNRILKSKDGGKTFYGANNGFDDWGSSKESPFVTKIAKNNSDPNLLFVISRSGVWKSLDFGDTWKLSPINNLDDGGRWFSNAQVAISQASPQVVWAASRMNGRVAPYISKDGGLTFAVTKKYSEEFGILSGLDTHPTDEATAYLTFSFLSAPKILRTTDYGEHWEDITGFGTGDESTNGFPNVGTFTVLVMPFDTNIIWAGTEIGIVESIDNGATWHLLDSNMPSVSIWEMKIVDDQVVIATHGRGIWSVTLDELAGYKPPVVTLAPIINGNVSITAEGIVINASLRSAYDSTQVMADNKVLKTIYNTEPTNNLIITAQFTESGNKSIYLKAFKDGKSYVSSSHKIFLFEFLAPKAGFYSGFASDDGAFALDGFNIGKTSGFTSSALQTEHNYLEKTNYYAVLKTPIIVSDTDAILSYKDVAIIETGDEGTVFGQQKFWDYVIVEGFNKNSWVPLLDGYDATSDSKWLAAYNNKESGNESMFKSHTINLLDNFQAGDTILIRFRLYSDDLTVGWGWLVDDLLIQGQYVGVEDNSVIPTNYALEQNYPNPFNPSTTISFALPKTSNVKINVYNSLGQLVETLYNSKTEAGIHTVNWNAVSVSSGIYYYTIKAGDFSQTKKMILLK